MNQRWMAWLMRHAMAPYERRVARRKQELFQQVRGRVIEIGCGTRPNLPFLGGNAQWIGTDPNFHMRPPVCAAAEQLPFADATAETVIGTLVLCSVGHPALVLQEVRRVLKPGGRFLFLEHVAAPAGTRMRTVQRLLRPICHACADGCNPLRDTGRTIEAAGFQRVEMAQFSLGLPHIYGAAIR